MSPVIITLPVGWTGATALRLYSTATRDGDPVEVPVVQSGGEWVADTGTATGRFYPTLVGTTSTGTATNVMPYTDLPDDDRLLVSPEYLATKAKIPLPLTEEQRETITDAILDAQADVVAYLGQPITPVEYVQREVYPWGDEWDLTVHGDAPVIRVLSADPVLVNGEPSGYFNVTYLAGLDAKRDPELRPIRRFVVAHAMNSPEFTDLWKVTTGAKGEVRSVSAEGQSVAWGPATLGGGGQAGSGMPGALPTLASLDKWREAGRRVVQGPTRVREWPYGGYVSSNRDWFER